MQFGKSLIGGIIGAASELPSVCHLSIQRWFLVRRSVRHPNRFGSTDGREHRWSRLATPAAH